MITRIVAAAAVALLPAALVAADDFKTATPPELAMKDVTIAPGASAAILDWVRRQDDKNLRAFEYIRIKVLKDEGKKYGDVSITHVPPLMNVDHIKARVTKPDGTAVTFDGKIYDKVVVRAGGVRVVSKTFTLPDVQPGSILEYSYERSFREGYHSHFFAIQRELPVLRELVWMRPSPSRVSTLLVSYKGLPAGKKPTDVGDHFELEIENIAAYEEEPYAPPEDCVKPIVIFYYSDPTVMDSGAFWNKTARLLGESIEDFLTDRAALHEAAQQAAAGAATPEEKLRKLYARAQQVRNLTFEPHKPEQEERELRDNRSSIDVLNNGYGRRDDINRFFVSLARAAGFEANVVRIGDRAEWFLSKNLPLRSQLNNEVAMVKVGGKDVLLDPATPFAPYGMLSWEKTSVSGIKIVRKPDAAEWIEIPQDRPDAAQIKRVARLRIDGDTLKGTAVVTYLGHDAMSVRHAQRNHDEDSAKKAIEETVKNWFFNGSSVKLTKLTGLRGIEEPLVAEFDVELPSTGAVTGSRAIVPMAVFSAAERSPLSSERRKNDLYFHYQYRVDDDVTLDVPAGYAVEAMPSPHDVDIGGLTFNVQYGRTPSSVHLTRNLSVKTVKIDVAQYPAARNFFKQVVTADQEQLVLKKAAK
jgi:hypothetical protein